VAGALGEVHGQHASPALRRHAGRSRATPLRRRRLRPARGPESRVELRRSAGESARPSHRHRPVGADPLAGDHRPLDDARQPQRDHPPPRRPAPRVETDCPRSRRATAISEALHTLSDPTGRRRATTTERPGTSRSIA
jgi:hypothetical protein